MIRMHLAYIWRESQAGRGWDAICWYAYKLRERMRGNEGLTYEQDGERNLNS